MDESRKEESLGLDDIMAMVFLSLLVIVTTLGVFMRYVVSQPLLWGEEIQILLFVWAIFFGASSVMKGEGHIGIDILIQFLPPKMLKGVHIFDNLLVMLILAVLTFLGVELSISGWAQFTPILKLKWTFMEMAIPVGGVCMIYQLAKLTWREFKRKEVT
ncbi:MAG TPA: TRAP transporter small permease [Desulfosporosinus sp.]|nr:TRAP transporter small permease [Desulfosporosinus sp.]